MYQIGLLNQTFIESQMFYRLMADNPSVTNFIADNELKLTDPISQYLLEKFYGWDGLLIRYTFIIKLDDDMYYLLRNLFMRIFNNIAYSNNNDPCFIINGSIHDYMELCVSLMCKQYNKEIREIGHRFYLFLTTLFTTKLFIDYDYDINNYLIKHK